MIRSGIVLFIITLFNVAIFLNKQQFQYVPFASYQQLYLNTHFKYINKWNKQPQNKYEWEEAKQILSANYLDTGTTLTKIMRIGQHIYSNLYQRSGKPSVGVAALSPLQQYKIFSQDRTEDRWCSSYGQIFDYFCKAANITCRAVEVLLPGDGHIINECFIPELKQWVVVDLLNKIFLAGTDSGYLNIISLREAIAQKKDFKLFSIEENKIVTYNPNVQATDMVYYHNQYTLHYYYETDLKKVYSLKNKAIRYLLPVSWYEVYTQYPNNNLLFYIKLFCFIIWIPAILWFAYKII